MTEVEQANNTEVPQPKIESQEKEEIIENTNERETQHSDEPKPIEEEKQTEEVKPVEEKEKVPEGEKPKEEKQSDEVPTDIVLDNGKEEEKKKKGPMNEIDRNNASAVENKKIKESEEGRGKCCIIF